MLFALDDDIDMQPEDALRQEENVQTESISPPVQRLDGKQDKWAPRYLCIAQPPAPFTNYAKGFKIRLSDMGGAYFFTSPPTKSITPRGLRAPELVLTGTTNKTLDIWRSKFEDDDHLLSLTARLGALPDELCKHWKSSPLYFTAGKLFNCQPGGVAEGGEPLMLGQTSMEDWFDQTCPDLDEEEGRQVKMLMRWILQYDPAKRPSPAEILSDPWFGEIEVESGSFK
ncbi:serine protein kinase, putative [Metarhizium acridum CQMa 102]|uniref:Serine protein kinase, putative n=1 Tax=Metarhizium acridum (strain CQMa 102) TaxID=655827 RepID=E9EGJ1_METAQ|nr:serine protein kinase, putative [Metarhizium acridum CQMa 102]EFY84957.1 serine protein kinase, putative [Metarhizium acridum CQMa 102]